MEAEIINSYDLHGAHEVSANWNGWNFLIIYGRHVNGWFIAIPNWKICIEACEPTDIYYNSEHLARELNKMGAGLALAQAIKEHWEGLKK